MKERPYPTNKETLSMPLAIRLISAAIALLMLASNDVKASGNEQDAWLRTYADKCHKARMQMIRRQYIQASGKRRPSSLNRNAITDFESTFFLSLEQASLAAQIPEKQGGPPKAGAMGTIEEQKPRITQVLSKDSAIADFPYLRKEGIRMRDRVDVAWGREFETVLLRGFSFDRATDGKRIAIDGLVWFPGETYRYDNVLGGSNTISVATPLNLTAKQELLFKLSSHIVTFDGSYTEVIGVPIGIRGRICEVLTATLEIKHLRTSKISPKSAQRVKSELTGFEELP